MNRALNVIALLCFSSTIFIRGLDPLIPQVGTDFSIDVATATLIATGFSLPYAFMQPVLGSLADLLGKTRLILTCMSLLVVGALVGAVAWTFPMLVTSRVICGMAAGGVFPIALAIVGDLAPMENRQIAISRLLAASMSGNIAGAALAGILGDFISWRAVLAAMAILGIASLIPAFSVLRHYPEAKPRFNAAAVWSGYRAVLSNPLAKICFGAVFVEGIFLQGLFPYVAILLHEQGETRAFIAGVVLGGFGLGGLSYTFAVAWVLPRLGERRSMILGGLFMGLGIFAMSLKAPWQIDFAIFFMIGFAFYFLHGCIHVYVTELATEARAVSTALHSAAFFIGQASGPILYGYAFPRIGLTAMLAVGGTAIFLTGIVCALTLRRKPLDLMS